ncbi:MAG: hypothetical protein QXK94_02180 [Candidatus Jordarchaeales archaeon]
MTQNDPLEMFKEILDEIKEYSERGVTLIVEGKKDRDSLRKIGFRGPIITISGVKIHEIVERNRGREVIILTDFDKEGERLAATILSYMIDASNLTTYFREKIRRLRTYITPCVEGFAKMYFKTESLFEEL